MGGHRLACGDVAGRDTLGRLLGGEPAAMAFSAPTRQPAGKGKARRKPVDPDQDHQALLRACRAVAKHTRGGWYLSVPTPSLERLFRAAAESGLSWRNLITWHRGRPSAAAGSDFRTAQEPVVFGWAGEETQPVLYGWEDPEHGWQGGRREDDLWTVELPSVWEFEPPREGTLPSGLVERAISNSSRRGETVLDPCASVGTTLIAAERLGRRARLVEVRPGHADVCVLRWQEHVQQQAVLEATGQTFAEVEVQRTAADGAVATGGGNDTVAW